MKKSVDALPSDWLIYGEMTRVSRWSHARTATMINPITVALFAGTSRTNAVPCDANCRFLGHSRLPNDAISSAYQSDDDSDESFSEEDEQDSSLVAFKVDDWINFVVASDTADLVYRLRQKLHALFLRRMNVSAKGVYEDDAVISTVAAVLDCEDGGLGLHQPVGVGQRPRPMVGRILTRNRLTSLSCRHPITALRLPMLRCLAPCNGHRIPDTTREDIPITDRLVTILSATSPADIVTTRTAQTQTTTTSREARKHQRLMEFNLENNLHVITFSLNTVKLIVSTLKAIKWI